MNIRDIAKKANVSVATVSRFLDLEKKALVHPKTQEHIAKIIQQYHYIPSRAARALSKQVSDTIGMVTPFSADVVKSPYFEGLIAGIIEGIRPLHYDLKWIMVRDEDIKNFDSAALIQKHSVDGVVFLSWSYMPNVAREMEHHVKIPVVLINDYHPEIRSSIVYCENKSGVQKICSYLVSKGYRKMGMLRGPEYISHDAMERFLAFKACSKTFGFTFSDSSLYTTPRFGEKAGYEAMISWIRRGKMPDAIFCANDDLAQGALQALRNEGVRVPEQVAVVGYDDSPRNELVRPFLTTVRQPTEAMGRAAVEILTKLIAGKAKGPIQMKFEPELIVRQSA